MVKKILFLNSLLFLGLLCSITPTYSVPVEVIPSQGIVYPIHVACECDYNLYVDGKKINPAGIVRNWDGTGDGVNVTNIFNPVLFEPSPKIIAFNNIDTEYPGFMNGFVMDMNNGKDYTKHTDWKCKYFDPKVSGVVPSNWMNYDYDDSEWEIAASYGMNYQNNSYQIFWHERDGIHLNAEWLWTSENTNPNIYCRKKRVDNEPYYVETKPVTTSAPSQTIHVDVDKTTLSPMHTTSAPSQTIHVGVDKTTLSPMHTTSAPSQTIHVGVDKTTLAPMHTTLPSIPVEPHKPVVTTTPTHVEPHKPVVTPTPTHVEPHKPVVTPTPSHVASYEPIVSPTPAVKPTPSKSKNNIIIYQHITYVIQKFKYTQKHSYSHIENLIRNLKYINQNHDLYKNLIYTRNHLLHHYNTMFKELYRLRKKYDANDSYYDDNDDNDEEYRILPLIHSMKILDKYVQEIEKYIQFIKGKYKYTLLNILAKLKFLYREDTIKLLQYY